MQTHPEVLAARRSQVITSDDLVKVLRMKVHAGSVTTYADVSHWAYGVRTRNHPVRALLRGAYSNGHQLLTNRVVKTNGDLAALPEGTDQQLAQLRSEGVPVSTSGGVDFKRTTAINLGRLLYAECAA